MIRFARHAETLGFESIAAVEHVVVPVGHGARYPYARGGRMPLPDDCAIPDPLELLSFLAGVTERIGLSTGVLVLPEHNPLVLAKRAATLDVLSGGRLRLGVGVGWMREELEAVGVDFASRGRRTDEVIRALRVLWREEEPSFSGEFFAFERARSHPKPLQRGGVPIHIGGHSAPAVRRAARLGDGFQPLGLEGEALEASLQSLRREAEAAGRDPSAIEVTLSAGLVDRVDADAVARAEGQGAHRVVLAAGEADVEKLADQMSAFAERVGLSGA